MAFRSIFVAIITSCWLPQIFCGSFNGYKLPFVNLSVSQTYNNHNHYHNYYDAENLNITTTATPPTTLQLVHVLFRHGPRTPVNTYPNDPYIRETFHPYGWGHLTNAGKRELFKMGQWLARRYENFLTPFYTPDLLHVQSSASPRTLMSMAAVLAGMFPPKNTVMEWNIKLNWQPIPIQAQPLDRDIWLRMTAECPRYQQALQEVLQRSEVQQELKRHENLFKELTEITGLNVTTAHDITSIYITLLAERDYGLNLPSWTQNYYPFKMQFMAEQSYIYNAYTTEMQRIKGGPLLQLMLEHMLAKAEGSLRTSQRKIYMYCAHDWSITNFLMALKVWKRQLPRFSALVLIELHRQASGKDYYVKSFFRNDPKANLEPLILPGCTVACPLDKVLELVKDVIPNASYEDMCRLKDGSPFEKYLKSDYN
uniref:Acid phosphatase n=1 Tax=Glossina pallidipes TaxID=7398 RepID=A0A1A9ZSA4_GLOPL